MEFHDFSGPGINILNNELCQQVKLQERMHDFKESFGVMSVGAASS